MKDVIILGFALFAMFLGAGNLIFPPSLGYIAGDQWFFSMIGFMITGIGMPVLGVITTAKSGGRIENLAGKVGHKFSLILGVLIMLAIGPLLAIPRTAATTYEMGIQPLFPQISPVVGVTIFFAITLFFTLNPSDVIDRIGSILTPALIVILGAIVIKALTTPIGVPTDVGVDRAFLRGFEGGYQTMDALGSIVLTAIVVAGIKEKGYQDKKTIIKMASLSGMIAAIGLAMVYGGLLYAGATASGVAGAELTRTELLIFITKALWGNIGGVVLALAITLACLTTSVGLTATAGDFFSRLSNGRVSYKMVVIIVCLFSGVFATVGVESIVAMATPILATLYPVTIVLILLSVFDRVIRRKATYRGAVFGAFLVSLFQGLSEAETIINNIVSVLFSIGPLKQWITPTSISFDLPLSVIAKLPLATEGFAWIVPAIVFGILFTVFDRKKEMI